MDKSDRPETHDFMNVESFSQLPFKRPAAPVKERGGIRLFGIEFAGDAPADDSSELSSFTTKLGEDTKDNETSEGGRKFECHYCCRSFPTSQALGGHQNAHKRERQHAKRAHLQSALAHSSNIPDGHLYGLVNYRLSSTAATPRPSFYASSWSTINNTTNSGNSNISSDFNALVGSRNHLYRNHHGSWSHHHNQHQHQHHQAPINGSPLAMWRIPSFQSNNNRSLNNLQERSSLQPLPAFVGYDSKLVQVGSSNPQNRHLYETKPTSLQEHVSLDLRL